jgi:hypothetical protein
MKTSAIRGLAVTMIAAAAAGCSGDATPPPPATTMAAQPAATAPAAGAATAGTSDFGVPECDSYIRKYLACVDTKVPADQRAMVRQSIEATQAQWKQAASTPQARQSMAATCVQAEAAAKQAMASYGCTW